MFALRTIIILAFVLSGYVFGAELGQPVYGIVGGLILGVITNLLDRITRNVTLGSTAGGIMGLALGLLTAYLLLLPLRQLLGERYAMAYFAAGSLAGYGGFLLGVIRGSGFTFKSLLRMLRGEGAGGTPKLLDTSVIIDGRIADICETGFIEGEFVVPHFILIELQHIADSSDSMKRGRGRRGLDILQRMQKMHQITVRIIEDDFPKIREVDSKLVALGRKLGAKVVTNDFNLNKVAELQGVTVLNINELANAIKPLVLPGEPMKVFIIKEGKEQNQGVAYLEDGTMVVVDNGRRQMGKNVDVTVTSVLQTTAGRMIFTKIRENGEVREREEVRVLR